MQVNYAILINTESLLFLLKYLRSFKISHQIYPKTFYKRNHIIKSNQHLGSKLEINNKRPTFVKKLLLVSFDASVKLETISKTKNLKINKQKLLEDFSQKLNLKRIHN